MWCLIISIAFEYFFLIWNIVWIIRGIIAKRKKPKKEQQKDKNLVYKWVRETGEKKKKGGPPSQPRLFGNFTRTTEKRLTPTQEALRDSMNKSSSGGVNTADSDNVVKGGSIEAAKKEIKEKKRSQSKKIVSKKLKKGPKTTKVKKLKVNKVRPKKGGKKKAGENRKKFLNIKRMNRIDKKDSNVEELNA